MIDQIPPDGIAEEIPPEESVIFLKGQKQNSGRELVVSAYRESRNMVVGYYA